MSVSVLDGAHVPLAVAERGGEVESVHAGSVAVVDADGRLVASAGSPGAVVFARSSLKPLQALPFVAAGGPARFGLSAEQVALVCASHSGEARHQAAVADLLRRAGCRVDELRCGSHAPYVYETLGEPPPPPPYSSLAHNCSGKHAGMLACCVLHGWPREGYLDAAHPLQAAIREVVSRLAGVRESDLRAGIDGCSAPNYAFPLAGLARAYARLATDADDADGAARRAIVTAMAGHPEYVSGVGRADARLMQAGRGAWFSKSGAEGVAAIGLPALGLGVAVKVADGSSRAVLPVAIAILESLGVLDEESRRELAPWTAPVLHNARGLAVGRLRPVVVLDKLAEARASPVGRGRR